MPVPVAYRLCGLSLDLLLSFSISLSSLVINGTCACVPRNEETGEDEIGDDEGTGTDVDVAGDDGARICMLRRRGGMNPLSSEGRMKTGISTGWDSVVSVGDIGIGAGAGVEVCTGHGPFPIPIPALPNLSSLL